MTPEEGTAYDSLGRAARTESGERQLHLNLFVHSRGHHEASWRHPDTIAAGSEADIRYYFRIWRSAPRQVYSTSIFLADQLALGGDVGQAARTWLEPVTVLAAVAWWRPAGSELIATCSTTYAEPFNLARQFASIDHISNGRAAWNIVTSWLAASAANFWRCELQRSATPTATRAAKSS